MSNTIPYFEAVKQPDEKRKPSLYDQDNRYSLEANALYNQGYHELRPVFKTFFNLGYSPREIAHLLQDVVRDLESEAIL